MQEEVEDLDEEAALLARNFKRFLEKKVGVTSSGGKMINKKEKRPRGISRLKKRRRTPRTRPNAISAKGLDM